MKLSNKEIINQIYKDVFDFSSDHTKNVFLCGAKINKDETLRHYISEKIKEYPMYNVVFPENLFDSLTTDGGFNILDLENKLADDADLIVMPLEGYSTFTELGAFSCNDRLHNRIIVISDNEFKDDRSFINLGPIKLIFKENESHVIYYKKRKTEVIPSKRELNRIFDQLLKVLRYYIPKDEKKGINNIFDLSRFLVFLIGVYDEINLKEIGDLLEEVFSGKLLFHLIEPSIANLCSSGFIKIDKSGKYSLSEIGYKYVLEDLLDKFKLKKKFSMIKAIYINSKYRKKKKFDLEKERKRFLDL